MPWEFNSNEALIKHLVNHGYLKTPSIIDAFKKVDRIHFVPEERKDEAYIDAPLAIGNGQTISQPLTVAFMLELLSPQKGNKVLDIGAGSGWVTALLAEIVGPTGYVYAYEIIPAVGFFGKSNLKRTNYKNISYTIGDFFDYFEDNAPYDRIIAGAAFAKIPVKLLQSLKEDGILVAPTQDGDIRRILRNKDNYEEESYYGFSFVPITGKLKHLSF
jgi:protein-L-isoaspartate(D-aspartate) O-methyltransferase